MSPLPSSALIAAGALLGVLGLIWAAQFVVRRTGFLRIPSPSVRMIAVEERLAVDARRMLLLVRCGDRRVLVMTGAGADTVLGWLP